MKSLNNNQNTITNVTFDQIITYSDNIFRFTDIPGINPIPNNSIVYKTVTGIGATHSEIEAKRHSIIVMPHIAIVTSKHEDYLAKGYKTLVVYGDVKLQTILDYLFSDNEYAKILTTPKGLNKIIKVMELIRQHHEEINYKKMFFLLIDECHKLIQEADYRKDIVEVMDHFFQFENKAMVSATPIPPSDEQFKEHRFKHIQVKPETMPKVLLELIHVNSIVNGLKTYIDKTNAERYCIFFNSIIGINFILDELKQDDYKVFCSRESKDIQLLNGRNNVSYEVGELTRFNFFTSSFFSGLDIHSDTKPNIVILTDCGFKSHTLIDPYTDALQIIGRFRKQSPGDIPYKKVVHINNSAAFTNPISHTEALRKIDVSREVYKQLETLKLSLKGDAHLEIFKQALKTVAPYSRLVNEGGVLCHYLKDNYLDDERVKNYYASATALNNAYHDTKLYNFTWDSEEYLKIEFIKLQSKSLRYSKTMNIQMTEAITKLEDYAGLDIYHEQDYRIAKLSYVMHQAYRRLGPATIGKLNYSKPKLEKELLKLDIEEGKNSFPVIDIIYRHFQLNKSYTLKVIKGHLQKLFNEYNVKCIAKANDIERYFEFVAKKEGDDRVYVFIGHKVFPANQQKHI